MNIKIYGTPYKGKKSKIGYGFNAVRITKGGKAIQILGSFRKEIAGKDLIIFGTEGNTIFLNFISVKENNGYDAYTITKNSSISARTFIREEGLKEGGIYKVEKVTPTVYKFNKEDRIEK